MEETKEVQEKRIEYFVRKGTSSSRRDGRNAEITVDLVLQARAKLSDNEVNGPEDVIVSEMIKRLPMEKIYTKTRCCQERFSGSDGVSKLMEGGEAAVLEDAGCRVDQRDQKLQSNSMSKWYASCLLRLEKEKEPETWKKLHIGGLDGISCQHLQVMMTNVIQKHWGWQEKRNPVMRHGTVVRPTMYLASLDIKTVLMRQG